MLVTLLSILMIVYCKCSIPSIALAYYAQESMHSS